MNTIIGTLDGMQYTIGDVVLEFSYLLAALLFVTGLKLLSHPKTARNGNLWASGGMALAMLTTILLHKDGHGNNISITNIFIIFIAIGIGAIIGWIIARKIKMTAMPQLVSFYNATGGAASALVGLLEYPNAVAGDVGSILVTVLGLIIGAIAFSGSLVAYGKLDGKIGDIMKPFMTYVNLLLLLITLGLGVFIVTSPAPPSDMIWAIYTLFGISILYGILFVMPIGGADMPVVISLLNSLTGIAAAMAGFIYNNMAMILGGILVG